MEVIDTLQVIMFFSLFFLQSAQAATPSQLTASMAIPAVDIVSETLLADPQATAVLPNLGILQPTEGSDFAYLYTGAVGQGPQIGTDLGPSGQTGDRSTLTVVLQAPPTANSARFDFYFLSAEYPEFVNTSYNDAFEANIIGTAFTGNAAIDSQGNDVTVNSAYFTITQSADLQGTGFDNGNGGGTDWLTMVVPVDPNDTVTFEFTIYDVYDGIYDSSVLLDNFAWSTADIDTPVIVTPIRVDYLSPKRGPTNGGITTEIYGIDFNATCTAFFDGVEAPQTTFINSTRLVAEVPPHAVGLVDVTVNCIAVDDILVGGFTYFDGEDGQDPPEIHEAAPYQVYTEGGDVVMLTGAGFQDGALVSVDGVEVDSEVLSEDSISFTTAAHDEGFANVRIENPDGLSDERSGLLYFYPRPTDAGPTDTGTEPDTDARDTEDTASDNLNGDAPKTEGGCSSLGQPLAFSWLSLGLVALLLRRREDENASND